MLARLVRRTAPILALTAACGVTAPMAAAQPAAQPGTARIASAETLERLDYFESQFGGLSHVPLTVDFEGGTVAEYIEAIEEALDMQAVFASVDLDHIDMPPVELSAVPFVSAIGILQEIPVPDGAEVSLRFEETLVAVTVLGLERAVQQEEGLIETLTRSLTLSQGDEGWTERVLSGVEAAAEFLDDDELELTVHEPTGLLFARGDVRSLLVIEEAIVVMEEESRLIEARKQQQDFQERNVAARIQTNAYAQFRAELERERSRANVERDTREALEVANQELRDRIAALEDVVDSLQYQLAQEQK